MLANSSPETSQGFSYSENFYVQEIYSKSSFDEKITIIRGANKNLLKSLYKYHVKEKSVDMEKFLYAILSNKNIDENLLISIIIDFSSDNGIMYRDNIFCKLLSYSNLKMWHALLSSLHPLVYFSTDVSKDFLIFRIKQDIGIMDSIALRQILELLFMLDGFALDNSSKIDIYSMIIQSANATTEIFNALLEKLPCINVGDEIKKYLKQQISNYAKNKGVEDSESSKGVEGSKSSKGVEGSENSEHEISSSSNTQLQSPILIREVIARIPKECIMEQITLFLTDPIASKIIINPVAVMCYSNDTTSSMKIFDVIIIIQLMESCNKKMEENITLLNQCVKSLKEFPDDSQSDKINFLINFFKNLSELKLNIQQLNPKLFFDGAHTMNELLYGDNKDKIAIEMLTHYYGENTIYEGRDPITDVITIAIKEAVKILSEYLNLGTWGISYPPANETVDINNITSARLFVDIILLIINYWGTEYPNSLSLISDFAELEEQINLLNQDQFRLIAAQNTLTNIICNTAVNTYEGLTIHQVQHLRSLMPIRQTLEATRTQTEDTMQKLRLRP